MSNEPFTRERYLAIRAAALESRKHDRVQAAAIAVALHRASATPPVAPRRGLLARLRGKGAS